MGSLPEYDSAFERDCPRPDWFDSEEGEAECEFYRASERPPPENVFCTTGEARHGQHYHVCCAASCGKGKCGGVGCNMRPGGRENCCVGTIRDSGKECKTPED